MDNIKNFLAEIKKVYDCGYTKVRFGNQYDGGYIVLDELCDVTDFIYSAGVGEDVSFELGFVTNNAHTKVKLFDPTIYHSPIIHDNFEFFKSKIDQTKEIYRNSILKMDIEWDEWETLKLFSDGTLQKFNQILIEFHVVHTEPKKGLSPYFNKFYKGVYAQINEVLFETYYETIKRLNQYFYIYHIHANNSLPEITIGEYKFPPLLELSFVRKDLVREAIKIKTKYPIQGLDFPNKADRPDILGFNLC